MTTLAQVKSQSIATSQAAMARFILGLVLAACSGVMFLLAFPPYGLWPLAWIGLVPALLAQYRLLPLKWSSLAQAIFGAIWLGPFLARLFGEADELLGAI